MAHDICGLNICKGLVLGTLRSLYKIQSKSNDFRMFGHVAAYSIVRLNRYSDNFVLRQDRQFVNYLIGSLVEMVELSYGSGLTFNKNNPFYKNSRLHEKIRDLYYELKDCTV